MKLATMAVMGLGLAALVGSAQASLINRGGGMIYDTELNITWLQNWNQGAGSVYDATWGMGNTGQMTWDLAQAWAANLVWGGFDDWRLPTMMDTGAAGCDFSNAGGTDCGQNVQTKSGGTVYSEMAHLWYETLGNKAVCAPGDAACRTAQPGHGLTNAGPFTNMRPGDYWFGNEYAPWTSRSWNFNTNSGVQNWGPQSDWAFAVAVRPGDVTVPEPQTLALALLAFGAGVLARQRRPRSRG